MEHINNNNNNNTCAQGFSENCTTAATVAVEKGTFGLTTLVMTTPTLSAMGVEGTAGVAWSTTTTAAAVATAAKTATAETAETAEMGTVMNSNNNYYNKKKTTKCGEKIAVTKKRTMLQNENFSIRKRRRTIMDAFRSFTISSKRSISISSSSSSSSSSSTAHRVVHIDNASLIGTKRIKETKAGDKKEEELLMVSEVNDDAQRCDPDDSDGGDTNAIDEILMSEKERAERAVMYELVFGKQWRQRVTPDGRQTAALPFHNPVDHKIEELIQNSIRGESFSKKVDITPRTKQKAKKDYMEFE